jgi:hypothetical protein
MPESPKTQLLPFHESIVKAIRTKGSEEDFLTLAMLIESTKIPKGHDEIIAAIDECWGPLEYWKKNIASLKANLLAQKEAVEASKAASQDFSLDILQGEVEQLFALLKNRELGLGTWHEQLRERLQNMQAILSIALGK